MVSAARGTRKTKKPTKVDLAFLHGKQMGFSEGKQQGIAEGKAAFTQEYNASVQKLQREKESAQARTLASLGRLADQLATVAESMSKVVLSMNNHL